MRSNPEKARFGTIHYFEGIGRANRRLARSVSRKASKSDWAFGKAAWREARIVSRFALQMTLIVWAARIVSELLDERILNESILAGHFNQDLVDLENRIDAADRGGR